MLTIIAAIVVGSIILALCFTQDRVSNQQVRFWIDYSRIMRDSQK